MTTATAFDARWTAVRAGLNRGLIETRQNFTEVAYVIGHALPPVAYIAVLLFIRGKTVPGTDFPLVAMMLPSLLGLTIAYGGLSTPALSITADREDGTLLRAKATPHGMIGYLVGKIVMFALTTLLGVVAILVPGNLIVDDLILGGRAWGLLALIYISGMVSTVTIGVALGSVMKSSAQATLVPLAWTLVMFASGIFYPITVLPTWLQWLAQAFPVYWLGLGTRSPSSRRKWLKLKLASPGGPAKCSLCSARGRYLDCCWRRSSCAAWLGVSRARRWPRRRRASYPKATDRERTR